MNRIIFVAHGDHNFDFLKCKREGDIWTGHMDNQIGVFSVLQAYFSGRLPSTCVNIEITYGEEQGKFDKEGNFISFVGAREVMQKIEQDDLIVVVDVTCLPEEYQGVDFSIEKCKNKYVRQFLEETFSDNFKYHIFENTPDTEACEDQTDAFRQVTQNVFFFGIQVYGGDYNRIPVKCNIKSQQRAVQAMIVLANAFEQKWKGVIAKMPKSPERQINEEFTNLVEQMNKMKLVTQSEEDSQQQEDWKQIYRRLKFSKNKLLATIQLTQNYDAVKNSNDFLETMRKDKQVTDIFKTHQINGTQSLLIILRSQVIANLLIKDIKSETIFDNKNVKQCFILEKQKRKNVVINVVQSRISNMVIFIENK